MADENKTENPTETTTITSKVNEAITKAKTQIELAYNTMLAKMSSAYKVASVSFFSLATWKKALIIIALFSVCCSGSWIAGCACGVEKYNQVKVVVKEKKVTKTVYIYPAPSNTGEYKNCYQSPILFDMAMKGSTLYIAAGDKCKSVKAEYEIKPTYWKHDLLLTPGVLLHSGDNKLIPMFGGGIAYTHNFNSHFGLGGQPFGYVSMNKQYWDAGANIVLKFSW